MHILSRRENGNETEDAYMPVPMSTAMLMPVTMFIEEMKDIPSSLTPIESSGFSLRARDTDATLHERYSNLYSL